MSVLNKKNSILKKLLSVNCYDHIREMIVTGKSKIMLSCPHTVPHYRNGKIKHDEPNTLIVAHYLHKIYDVPYIYKINSNEEDANFDKKSNYKSILCDYIIKNGVNLLIDLHEMKPSRKEIINIGTKKFKNIKNINILNSFIRVFSSEKLGLISIDEPFAASGNYRVSTYIHKKTKINCLQIELNSSMFLSDVNYNSILKAFKMVIKNILLIMENNYEK